MLDKLLSIIAPHYCCGCGVVGGVLCNNCKNDIIENKELFCIACCGPSSVDWLCDRCHLPYERAYIVGWRIEALKGAIDLYKFERAMCGFRDLGDLLISILPDLSSEAVVIVPVPTVASHVRKRGYDQVLLMAKYIAKEKDIRLGCYLDRLNKTSQMRSGCPERWQQARSAFIANRELDPTVTYLLVDDVVTTGATVKYAALALKDAGAKHVWVAALARQPLD